MKKKQIDLDVFKKKYLLENLAIQECASYFDCGKTTIVRFCKKHNIKKPKNLRAKNISSKRIRHDHEEVKRLYFNFKSKT